MVCAGVADKLRPMRCRQVDGPQSHDGFLQPYTIRVTYVPSGVLSALMCSPLHARPCIEGLEKGGREGGRVSLCWLG